MEIRQFTQSGTTGGKPQAEEPGQPRITESRLVQAARRLVRTLFASLAAIGALVAGYVYFSLRDNAGFAYPNIVFVGNQLRAEYLNLRVQLAEAMLVPPLSDRDATVTNYEILLSRLDTIEQGRSLRAYVDEGALAGSYLVVAREVRDWEHGVKAFVEGDAAAGRALLQRLDAAAPTFGALASDLNVFGMEQQARTDRSVFNFYVILLLSSLGAAAAIGVLVHRMLRGAQAAETAHRNLAQVARDLEVARRHAEAANRAKSSFLASMSHELRTPLNAIIGFSEIMTQGMFGPLGNRRYDEYVASIQQSGQHLLSLINDILDMSRIEAGRYDLNEEFVDVSKLVQGAINLVGVRAAEQGVTITHIGAEESVELWADERALRQIILNLLSNAVKFSAGDGAVSVAQSITADGFFEVSVSDSGIGMTESELAHAFEPFRRSDSQLVRQSYQGTGLGLPITRRLMELHGGTMVIRSEKGAGTVVTLRFPAERIGHMSDVGAIFGLLPPG